MLVSDVSYNIIIKNIKNLITFSYNFLVEGLENGVPQVCADVTATIV